MTKFLFFLKRVVSKRRHIIITFWLVLTLPAAVFPLSSKETSTFPSQILKDEVDVAWLLPRARTLDSCDILAACASRTNDLVEY